VRILKTIQAEAKPAAKLLLLETIVEDSNEPQFAKILDIWMLAHVRGKERTRAECRNLLGAGGFRLSRTDCVIFLNCPNRNRRRRFQTEVRAAVSICLYADRKQRMA
jgi:hypothetical protein